MTPRLGCCVVRVRADISRVLPADAGLSRHVDDADRTFAAVQSSQQLQVRGHDQTTGRPRRRVTAALIYPRATQYGQPTTNNHLGTTTRGALLTRTVLEVTAWVSTNDPGTEASDRDTPRRLKGCRDAL